MDAWMAYKKNKISDKCRLVAHVGHTEAPWESQNIYIKYFTKCAYSKENTNKK